MFSEECENFFKAKYRLETVIEETIWDLEEWEEVAFTVNAFIYENQGVVFKIMNNIPFEDFTAEAIREVEMETGSKFIGTSIIDQCTMAFFQLKKEE